MGDLSQIEASQSVKVAGGNEQHWAGVSPLKELVTADTLDNGGLDKVLDVVSGLPEELKVGISVKENRKYVIFMALDTGLTFGFTSLSQSIPIFKNQLIMFPAGVNTEIWFASSAGTKQVAIGEL